MYSHPLSIPKLLRLVLLAAMVSCNPIVQLFSDEIHLSFKGEDLLAESICNSLIKKLNKNKKQKEKSNLDEINYLKERKLIGINSKELNIDIRRYISQNLYNDESNKISVSTDVYTTS